MLRLYKRRGDKQSQPADGWRPAWRLPGGRQLNTMAGDEPVAAGRMVSANLVGAKELLCR